MAIGYLQEPVRTMALVDASTGLRASELTGLRWQDVEFDAGVLHVRRGVVTGGRRRGQDRCFQKSTSSCGLCARGSEGLAPRNSLCKTERSDLRQSENARKETVPRKFSATQANAHGSRESWDPGTRRMAYISPLHLYLDDREQ